jgi:hypothetical protein
MLSRLQWLYTGNGLVIGFIAHLNSLLVHLMYHYRTLLSLLQSSIAVAGNGFQQRTFYFLSAPELSPSLTASSYTMTETQLFSN